MGRMGPAGRSTDRLRTLAAWSSKTAADRAAQREFEEVCNQVGRRLGYRLDAASLILRSGAAFLAASEPVTREEWRVFTRRLEMEQQLPGIQGIGFALWIPREQLAAHIQTVRDEGFPDYQVRPPNEREFYSSIIYLEPFSDRNLRAFGFDMYSEPVRRAAMERARDKNAAALSGKVILMQETGQDVQSGALLYFPAYRPGAPAETIEQRRADARQLRDESTRRKRADEEAKKAAVYLDIMPDALIVTTPDTKIITINKAFSELWG